LETCLETKFEDSVKLFVGFSLVVLTLTSLGGASFK